MILLNFILLVLGVIRKTYSHKCQVIGRTANCAQREFTSVPQNLPRNITDLNLNGNLIFELKNFSFKRYEHLTILSLNDNKLSFLDQNVFYGLEKLTDLFMTRNNLKLSRAYGNGVFKPLKALLHLYINQNSPNKIESPTSYPFFGDLLKLTNLSIDLVYRPLFDKSGFDRLDNLKTIRFDYCSLEQMSNRTFEFMTSSVRELDFHKCYTIIRNVQADFLKPFVNLQTLRLHQVCVKFESALKILYPFENKQMTKIDFTQVNEGCIGPIKSPTAVIITSEMMKHLQTICIKTLYFVENGIADFEPNSLLWYKYPECFEEIVLSRNRFSVIDGFKASELYRLSISLTNLTKFDFSFNPLSYNNEVDKPLRSTMDKVIPHNDYLIENHIVRLWNSTLPYKRNTTTEATAVQTLTLPLPPKLKQLRISHLMQREGIGNDKKVVIKNASNLRYVDLSYFQMEAFPYLTISGQNNIKFINVSGINFIRYSTDQLLRQFQNSTAVILRHVRLGRTVYSKGSIIFKHIPNVQKLDISSNNMWFLPNDALSSNTALHKLIMDYNLFSEIPIAVLSLSKLRWLQLKFNIIQTINSTVRDWMEQQRERVKTFHLELSGNIFRCTCETKEFIRWIFQTQIILDMKNKAYKCQLSNGTISNTLKVYREFHEIFGNCESGIWLRIGVDLLTAFIVLAVPLAIVLNFRWQIAYWIFRKFKKVVENKMKQKFNYDIYVSYASDSVHWVKNTLVPKIENSWGMKMCLEDRDILVGHVCADAISKSIEDSRNIIFIISETFTDRIWGNFEIERAKYEKYTRNLQHIIVITKHVSVEQIPAELGLIWRDVNFIPWPEDESEVGWDRLKIVLLPNH